MCFHWRAMEFSFVQVLVFEMVLFSEKLRWFLSQFANMKRKHEIFTGVKLAGRFVNSSYL